jgi:flagellin
MGEGSGTEATALITSATAIQTAANATIGSNAGSFTAVTISTTSVLSNISTLRATAGSAMNNAEFTIQAKSAAYEGQMAKKSRIMDANFAQETSQLSRYQILQQAGTAMVAQANAIPQNVLALLR